MFVLESVLYLVFELVFVAALLLLLCELKPKFGLVFVFIFVASNQYLQTILANTVYLKITDGVSVSPGSMVFFTSSIFATLLVYLKNGIHTARVMIYGIAVSNFSLIVLAFITQQQMALPSFINNTNISSSFFNLNIKLVVIGTCLLLVDTFLIVIIFNFISLKLPKIPKFLKIFLALSLIMAFDSFFFNYLIYWDALNTTQLFVNDLIGKLLSCFIFSLILFTYLKFKKITRHIRPKNLKEVFSIIYNQDKYEVLKKQKEFLESENKTLNKTNDSQNKFLAILSHDLRSPFTAILGFSELLKENFDSLSHQEKKEYVNYIHMSSKNGLDLFQNLLEWSKVQMNRITFSPNKINFTQLIDHNIHLLEPHLTKKNISVVFDSANTITLNADQNLLNSVIQNLLFNAVKFSHKSSIIEIKLNQLQNEIHFLVKDYGIGISKENIDKLFNNKTHYTTYGTHNEKGSGLGLILCREFIELHKGKIWVDSEFGKGSEFHVVLPVF